MILDFFNNFIQRHERFFRRRTQLQFYHSVHQSPLSYRHSHRTPDQVRIIEFYSCAVIAVVEKHGNTGILQISRTTQLLQNLCPLSCLECSSDIRRMVQRDEAGSGHCHHDGIRLTHAGFRRSRKCRSKPIHRQTQLIMVPRNQHRHYLFQPAPDPQTISAL